MKLSIVLATKNEENKIGNCLESIKKIADEIIIFDEYSEDKTRDIAKKYGAKIYKWRHRNNFHETKQKALEKAKGEWILQLDADEVVTDLLAKEIIEVINMDLEEIKSRKINSNNNKLFQRHKALIEKRDGKIGKNNDEVVAFFIPRMNFFLGKPLKYAGVYPDGVIRLVKNGKAYFPAKSVHEQIQINGGIDWLYNDLEHHDSPTLHRYISRMNRYTDLRAKDFQNQNVSKNIINLLYYSSLKPIIVFFKLYFRHKGFKDGIRGFVWSAFSALHFPIGYYKYFNL